MSQRRPTKEKKEDSLPEEVREKKQAVGKGEELSCAAMGELLPTNVLAYFLMNKERKGTKFKKKLMVLTLKGKY